MKLHVHLGMLAPSPEPPALAAALVAGVEYVVKAMAPRWVMPTLPGVQPVKFAGRCPRAHVRCGRLVLGFVSIAGKGDRSLDSKAGAD